MHLLDTGPIITISNGHLATEIDKSSGTFRLAYDGNELVHQGYWSQVGRSSFGSIARFGTTRSIAVVADPVTNGGERADVLCRFGYDGHSAGLPCDVDLHYAVSRGDTGLYVYAVWRHSRGYPAFGVGEGRLALKLNPQIFDYLTIDDRRRRHMPTGYDWDHGVTLNLKEARRLTSGIHKGEVEHKYDYSAILADTPAYGWSSTTRHIGLWMINPSIEYLAGGPTKVELTGHLDGNPGGVPVLLNMWHGSHYGGSSLTVARDEQWTKVIGPFLIYVNAASSPDQMWHDALVRAKVEQQAWPYAWVSDPDYPKAAQRGSVSGTLAIVDPQSPRANVAGAHVGLAAAPYAAADSRQMVDWQRDSKHYQFWTRADRDGRFTIRGVRPGSYTLYAFADGVLGEFSRSDVIVQPGAMLDLGRIIWKPKRFGRQLWEIGVPDRSAAEFRHGDDYWHWGLYYDYPREFPHDVDFVIGKSDWRRDWNYCQPPRIEGNRVQSTTWTIRFDLAEASTGEATLRLAICGSRGRDGIAISVNGRPAGQTGPLLDSGVMHRDGIRGYFCERDVAFDGTLLRKGTNTIRLTVPARSWVDGVLYDYLRLELEDISGSAGRRSPSTSDGGASR